MSGNLLTKEPCMGVRPRQWRIGTRQVYLILEFLLRGKIRVHWKCRMVTTGASWSLVRSCLWYQRGTLIRHFTFQDILVKRPIYFYSISNGKCALDPERPLGKGISHRRIPDTLPTLLLASKRRFNQLATADNAAIEQRHCNDLQLLHMFQMAFESGNEWESTSLELFDLSQYAQCP